MPDTDQLAFDLAALSLRLRETGEGALARELSGKITDAVRPLPDAVRAGLKPHLPDRYAGVLDEDLKLARRTVWDPDGTRVTVTATTPGIRRRLKRLDDGILAHPLWGNRKHWRNQQVGAGWFSGPAEDAIPGVRDAIAQAVREVTEEAAGK